MLEKMSDCGLDEQISDLVLLVRRIDSLDADLQ
jgi:hypothetical protein